MLSLLVSFYSVFNTRIIFGDILAKIRISVCTQDVELDYCIVLYYIISNWAYRAANFTFVNVFLIVNTFSNPTSIWLISFCKFADLITASRIKRF